MQRIALFSWFIIWILIRAEPIFWIWGKCKNNTLGGSKVVLTKTTMLEKYGLHVYVVFLLPFTPELGYPFAAISRIQPLAHHAKYCFLGMIIHFWSCYTTNTRLFYGLELYFIHDANSMISNHKAHFCMVSLQKQDQKVKYGKSFC